MGRTRNAQPVTAENNLDLEKIEAADQAARQLWQLREGYDQARDFANQTIGRVQAAIAIRDFSNVIGLSELKRIKENKLYRALEGQKGRDKHGNEISNVGTWDGFCLAVGTSASKTHEDISNFDAFGEEALAHFQMIGIGYRDLRQFRKLPADQKTALIEAAKSGDKDTLLDLAEDLIAKHTKEKESLTTTVDELRADNEAQSEVLASTRERLTELEIKVGKRKKTLPPPEPDEIAAGFVATAHKAEATACAWIEGHLRQAIADLLTHDEQHGSDHRPVLSGFIARIEDATDALRIRYAIRRVTPDDPLGELSADCLEKQGIVMPRPENEK